MYLKIGKDWRTIDITGAPVMQVRTGKVLFSDEESPPASDKDALIISKHEVKVANRKVIHLKTAENNQRESEVVFSAMVESDSSEGGGGGEGNNTLSIKTARSSRYFPYKVTPGSDYEAYIKNENSEFFKMYVDLPELTDREDLISVHAELHYLPCDAKGDFLPFAVDYYSVFHVNPMLLVFTLTVTGEATQQFDKRTLKFIPAGDGTPYSFNLAYTYQEKETEE